eukprot:1183388-Amphidinium_carterae.1
MQWRPDGNAFKNLDTTSTSLFRPEPSYALHLNPGSETTANMSSPGGQGLRPCGLKPSIISQARRARA